MLEILKGSVMHSSLTVKLKSNLCFVEMSSGIPNIAFFSVN